MGVTKLEKQITKLEKQWCGVEGKHSLQRL